MRRITLIACVAVMGIVPARLSARCQDVPTCSSIRASGQPIRIDGTETGLPFFGVSSAAIVDKGLVVADAGNANIRYYTLGGEPVAGVGRKGSGPGEFARPTLIDDLTSDSVVVFDSDLNRITILDDSGRVGRMFTLPAYPVTGMMVRSKVFARLDQREWLLQLGGGLEVEESGVQRVAVPLLRYHESSEVFDTVAVVQSDAVAVSNRPRRTYSSLPFLPKTGVAASGRSVFVSSGDAATVEVVPLGGSGTARRVRASPAHRELGRSDYDRWVESELERIPVATAVEPTRRFYGELFRPWPLPELGSLLRDPEGGVWAERFEVPGFDGARSWFVIDSRFRTCVFRAPPGLQLLGIGRDHVVGKRVLPTDEEVVEIWRISRS